MPLWIDAVAALMALTGLAGIVSGIRNAYRRPGPYELPVPFRRSIGDQAERWLRTQTAGE